jgi:murein DD-endopeptidase MepM/ murein hydrolase activator NlpD
MTMLAKQYSRHGGRLRLGLVAATALALGACSGSAERFADFSDVSTASLPAEQAAGSGANRAGEVETGILSSRPAWQNAPADSGQVNSGTVVVQSGQTLYSIARANDLTPDQLARANGIAPPYAIRVGQKLKVPGRADPVTPSARTDPQTIEAANAPSQRAEFSRGETHVVRPGETLFAVGRAYQTDPFTIAEYNRLSEPYALQVGQTLQIPAAGPSASRSDERPRTLDQQLADRQERAGQPQSRAAAPAPERIEAPSAPSESASQPDASVASTFRWPVRGRIISTFGQKPSGMRNEGINIAVPEGTPVRASESGVVAYAGNELKGYGNLVLIRHDGGWVTAYAHNKELFVTRGDAVKRGDIIANAGQTGSVTSPQVHFEIRKGATAVDPMKHLDTSQAMN